jgi:hypothetical protein
MTPRLDPDLEAAAEEEIARACELSWAQLSRVVPWGDSYEGITPGGRSATYERAYLWAEEQGGDVLVEVAVYVHPELQDHASRRHRLIRKAEHGPGSTRVPLRGGGGDPV